MAKAAYKCPFADCQAKHIFCDEKKCERREFHFDRDNNIHYVHVKRIPHEWECAQEQMVKCGDCGKMCKMADAETMMEGYYNCEDCFENFKKVRDRLVKLNAKHENETA